MEQELRAYFFQIMYLQGIHAGIQTQHTTAEMFVKYLPFEHKCSDMLYDWANNHKTTIILNGGYAANLELLEALLSDPQNPYPWAAFCESQEALRNCITNVGIILPEKIFNYNKNIEGWLEQGGKWSDYPIKLSPFELQLATEVSQCRLMA